MDGEITVDKNEVERLPLKQYFGIEEKTDTGWGEDLDFINGWAIDKGIKTSEDLLLEIKKMEYKMGTPTLGENRVTRLKHYLSLDAKLGRTLKEMAAYERNWDNVK
jgi:hypothetical protein